MPPRIGITGDEDDDCAVAFIVVAMVASMVTDGDRGGGTDCGWDSGRTFGVAAMVTAKDAVVTAGIVVWI